MASAYDELPENMRVVPGSRPQQPRQQVPPPPPKPGLAERLRAWIRGNSGGAGQAVNKLDEQRRQMEEIGK